MSERKETHKMQKKWNEYQIIDTRQLINKLPEDEREQYKHKVLFKNKCLTDDVMMFTKSDFKKYRENNDAYIVGKIKKQQKHYKVYEKSPNGSLLSYPPQSITVEELISKKQKKNIIGSATMEYPEFAEKVTDKQKCKLSDTDKPEYSKMYDVKEHNNSHTVGYAYIGDNKFLQVTTFNLLWLLLPLLLAIIIAVVLHSCPNIDLPFDTADGTSIDNNKQPIVTEQLPNCDYLIFPETITLTKDNPTIKLCNLSSNEGLWYISYQVYINNEPLMDINDPSKIYDTGAIKPGFQIDGTKDANLNLYDRLDAGTYKLTAKATQYKYEPNSKGQHLRTSVGQNIITTLVIEK